MFPTTIYNLILFTLIAAPRAHAQLTSWHNAHPIGWMGSAPVGESPGWSAPAWFNVEISQANIWNMQAEFADERNDNVYAYKADYEQTSTILDVGFAPYDWLGLSLEVPYANHNGGFLDDFTDQFHELARTSRFLRNYFPKFGNDLEIKTNDQSVLTTQHAEGVGNLKVKAKFWLLPWQSPTPGVCDCGLGISIQTKFPVQSRDHGLTSGTRDESVLLHLGAPWRTYSGIFATAGLTHAGRNLVLPDWPQNEWLRMFELGLDIGLNRNWGILAQARVESPLLVQKNLRYHFLTTDPETRGLEKMASGWDALTEWRGSEILGVRYRWGQGSRVSLVMMEDWGLGDRDHIGSWNYVNDAPDYAFITQWHFVF